MSYHVEPCAGGTCDLGDGRDSIKAWKVVSGELPVANLMFWEEGAALDFAELMTVSRTRRVTAELEDKRHREIVGLLREIIKALATAAPKEPR